MHADDLCYLDGRFLPLVEARISPLDRGFLYGDAVYEVVKVLGGRPLFLAAHLERLTRSLDAVAIPVPVGVDDVVRQAVARSGLLEGAVYLQISRGVGRREPIPPRDLQPTVFALPFAHTFTGLRPTGMSCVLAADPRWARCDIKTTALMGTVLGKLAAREAAADEVLFYGPGGDLREGGSVNIFVVRELPSRKGAAPRLVVETPPTGPHLLAGVTRAVLLGAVRAAGLTVHERVPYLAERGSWREIIVCGTLTGPQGVTRLDGEVFGDGLPGPVARQLSALQHAAEEAERGAVEAAS